MNNPDDLARTPLLDQDGALVEPASVPVELLHRLVESIPFPLYVIDVKTYIVVLANKAARTGSPRGPVTCHVLAHRRDEPCHRPGHPCPLAIVRATKTHAVVEHVHFDERGEARDVEVRAFPILDGSGEVTQVIEYSVDITDRKRLQREREETIGRLNAALAEVKTLRGLLPICANCNRIRDESEVWVRFEAYISAHTDADFTHSICPDCRKKLYGDLGSRKK
jgi:hypothetical protein